MTPAQQFLLWSLYSPEFAASMIRGSGPADTVAEAEDALMAYLGCPL